MLYEATDSLCLEGFVHLYYLCVCVCIRVELYMCLHARVCLFCCVLCMCSLCVSGYVCVCVFSLQDMNPYSTVTSDQTELDRRYCVLKLHVPYRDLLHSPDTNTGWDNNTVTFRQPYTT